MHQLEQHLSLGLLCITASYMQICLLGQWRPHRLCWAWHTRKTAWFFALKYILNPYRPVPLLALRSTIEEATKQQSLHTESTLKNLAKKVEEQIEHYHASIESDWMQSGGSEDEFAKSFPFWVSHYQFVAKSCFLFFLSCLSWFSVSLLEDVWAVGHVVSKRMLAAARPSA